MFLNIRFFRHFRKMPVSACFDTPINDLIFKSIEIIGKHHKTMFFANVLLNLHFWMICVCFYQYRRDIVMGLSPL